MLALFHLSSEKDLRPFRTNRLWGCSYLNCPALFLKIPLLNEMLIFRGQWDDTVEKVYDLSSKTWIPKSFVWRKYIRFASVLKAQLFKSSPRDQAISFRQSISVKPRTCSDLFWHQLSTRVIFLVCIASQVRFQIIWHRSYWFVPGVVLTSLLVRPGKHSKILVDVDAGWIGNVLDRTKYMQSPRMAIACTVTHISFNDF